MAGHNVGQQQSYDQQGQQQGQQQQQQKHKSQGKGQHNGNRKNNGTDLFKSTILHETITLAEISLQYENDLYAIVDGYKLISIRAQTVTITEAQTKTEVQATTVSRPPSLGH